MKRAVVDPLAVMLEARSVALVGASPRAGSLGARMIEEVAKSPSRPRASPSWNPPAPACSPSAIFWITRASGRICAPSGVLAVDALALGPSSR